MAVESRLLDVVLELSFCRDMASVAGVLRVAARDLTGADGVTVVLREGDLCHYVDENAISPLWKGRRFPMNACISGWCMLNRSQVAIPDIYQDDRIPHDAYRPTFVKSLAMTPIRSADPIGAIGAYWADQHHATKEELDVLDSLGNAAAMAIANAQLIGALTEADRRKERFIAMLAHELRNPLAPIRNGFHVLLNRAGEEPGAVRAGEMVERQLAHMTKLLNDLLDVSRLTNGQVELTRRRVDLRKIVLSNVNDLRDVFRSAGLSLAADVPEPPVWVIGDEARLTQAFTNVLDNARKFTGRSGRVHVELTTDDTTSLATIRVTDTGIGIRPEVLTQVFEPLSQEDTSLDRAPGGLGLGLTVARGLLELHGGSIAIESQGIARGTSVFLRVPRQPELPAVDGDAYEGALGAFDGRVLIVEDNVDAASSLQMVLELWGFKVWVAHSGPEGIRTAREIAPGIVVCDVGLPGMDGYAVAAALRSSDETRASRLIAVTGYGAEEDRRRALSAGFDMHLVKPVHPETLRKELERVH